MRTLQEIEASRCYPTYKFLYDHRFKPEILSFLHKEGFNSHDMGYFRTVNKYTVIVTPDKITVESIDLNINYQYSDDFDTMYSEMVNYVS